MPSDANDAPLNDIYASMRELEQVKFEDSVVNAIVTRLGLYEVKKRLLNDSRALTGRPRLTLAQFHTYVRNFPMLLGAQRFTGIETKLTISKILTEFNKLPILAAWDNLLDSCGELAEAKPVGLVFNWPSKCKYLVLHNAEPDRKVAGARLATWYYKEEQFCIEPLDLILESVASRDIEVAL